MTVMTSAGSTLAIATGLPATYDLAGFQAVSSPVTIGEITDLGDYGRTYTVVKHNPVGSRSTKKFKGAYDNGTMALKMGRDVSDAGQIAMKAALLSDNSYTFKLTLQDGSHAYFTAKVIDYKTMVGTVDQITGGQVTLEIDSDIVEG